MPNRKQTHLHLITETGGDLAAFSEHRALSLELMGELEDIQGVNDDLIQTIAAQNERIESVIIRLVQGGVHIPYESEMECPRDTQTLVLTLGELHTADYLRKEYQMPEPYTVDEYRVILDDLQACWDAGERTPEQ